MTDSYANSGNVHARPSMPDDRSACRSRTLQSFVVVLGMHRSGTSLVTRILNSAGYFAGPDADMIQAGRWNSKGYFERRSVLVTNDRLLEHAGGAWYQPPAEGDIRRLVDQNRFGETIQALMADYDGHLRAVVKDPRFCLTFPAWAPFLPSCTRIIRVIRNDRDAAASLKSRFPLSLDVCLTLGRIYNSRADIYMKHYPCFTIEYDLLLTPSRQQEITAALADFLQSPRDLGPIARQIIDPGMQHYHHTADLP